MTALEDAGAINKLVLSRVVALVDDGQLKAGRRQLLGGQVDEALFRANRSRVAVR